jgi:hypothetical protein
VRPRRSIPGSAGEPTRAAAAGLLATIGKAYAKKAAVFEKGLDTDVEPELAAVRRAAHAIMTRPTLEAFAGAEVETLAAIEKMLRLVDPRTSIAPVVAVARSLADALDAKIASLDLGLEHRGGFDSAVFVVSRPDERWENFDSWLLLRHAVCGAGERAYDEARRRASALRAGIALPRRGRIAYVFPDEPWGDEDLAACVAHPEISKAPGSFWFLIAAASDPDAVASFFALDRTLHAASAYALDIACALPEERAIALLADALPKLLVKPKYGPLLKTPPRQVATAIACFDHEAAAAVLADYVGHAILGPIAADYFRARPDRRHALEPLLGGRSKAAESAARIVARGQARERAPIASKDQVPAVLRDRPWRPRKVSAEPRVAALALPRIEERLDLSGAPAPTDLEKRSGHPVRDMTAAELADWRGRVEKKRYAMADYELVRGAGAQGASWVYARVPRDEGVRAWCEGRAFATVGPLGMLALHGLEAVPGFLALDWPKWLGGEGGEEYLTAASCIVSPRIALPMARVAARRKRYRRTALAWLLRHPKESAIGLVPFALGPLGDDRDDAEAAIVYLARRGFDELVRAIAREYGVLDDVARAIDRDPLAIDARAPKAPDFLRPDALPAVRLRSGARLDPESGGALLELLRVAPLDPPYPGVAQVREACDEASLAALARELVEEWLLAGAPGKHEWMLHSTVHFPSEDGTRRVASAARDWARKDRAKARRACVALAAIGSDLALMHLGHVAETSRFEDLRAEARSLLDDVAAERKLTADELADRTLPDLDLEGGALTLSFGARAFTVKLDETLTPYVEDGGTRLRSLPRATKSDDPVLAKAARARMSRLKTDAAAIAARELRRLERAMIEGRTWGAAELEERVVRHPLAGLLARRLVWDALGGPELRIAEDGTFSTSSDDRVELAPEARVRIAHPLRMRDRARWIELFADYEIIQPFEQLARELFAMTAAERSESRILRFDGAKAPAKRILGMLEARGWRRNDEGHVSAYLREVRSRSGAPLEASLKLNPGISIEDLASAPDQRLGAIEVYEPARRAPVRLAELDEVAFSELVRDAGALPK